MSTNARTSKRAVTRKELVRSRREDRRRHRRSRIIAVAGGAAVVISLLVVWGVISASSRPGMSVPDLGNLHIEEGTSSPIAYNSTPPTSGPHYGSLARWGVHTEPIPDELMVHNLEDGGVGIWYNCPDGCPDLVSQLESVAERYYEGVLLAPYPGIETQVALTAWNRIDRLDGFDEERIVRFIQAFRGVDHHVP